MDEDEIRLWDRHAASVEEKKVDPGTGVTPPRLTPYKPPHVSTADHQFQYLKRGDPLFARLDALLLLVAGSERVVPVIRESWGHKSTRRDYEVSPTCSSLPRSPARVAR